MTKSVKELHNYIVSTQRLCNTGVIALFTYIFLSILRSYHRKICSRRHRSNSNSHLKWIEQVNAWFVIVLLSSVVKFIYSFLGAATQAVVLDVTKEFKERHQYNFKASDIQ